MNEKTIAFVRLAIPLYAMLNATSLAMGYDPLPFESEKVDGFVTGAIGVIGLIVAWWKNNNVTPEAQQMQQALDDKKQYNQLKNL
ncbi:phage holin [Exiguobacterium sp. s102]|uniref:phage holin n=1 Tax=Exiguobacterium sp. s102 TaxID=2751212 RepID=UPI001BE5B955|nr:phage holin [Exiguobacterium sp. s102]